LWLTSLSAEQCGAQAAASVSFYNTAVNSASTSLFRALATTSLRFRPAVQFSPTTTLLISTIVGKTRFGAGVAVKTVSVGQCKKFKARPENKEKMCKAGLWRWVKHINYPGYSLWSEGHCVVGSGQVGGWP